LEIDSNKDRTDSVVSDTTGCHGSIAGSIDCFETDSAARCGMDCPTLQLKGMATRL
jgi:hypothetical protein